MQDQTQQNKKEGRIVLAWLLGFFITFAVVDAYFVYMAISTHTGTVVENPYEEGLNLARKSHLNAK